MNRQGEVRESTTSAVSIARLGNRVRLDSVVDDNGLAVEGEVTAFDSGGVTVDLDVPVAGLRQVVASPREVTVLGSMVDRATEPVAAEALTVESVAAAPDPGGRVWFGDFSVETTELGPVIRRLDGSPVVPAELRLVAAQALSALACYERLAAARTRDRAR